MESYLPLSGFQLPFQRRLSRLYNDTKKSSDFVKEPVQHAEDPEIKALHRKLRIQKDRLVSWGLEWSDPNQSAEIDESLSRAGLSDLVGSIMATIKDILAEAEPLWQSSKRLVGSDEKSEKGTGDKKMALVVWDKGRFEDLVKDLTTSIDTLYDLSRTRSTAASSSRAARARLFKSTASMEELRPFESTRMQTPQQIDPSLLTELSSMQPLSSSGATLTISRPREVVFMGKQVYAELPSRPRSQPWAPLLLEYAAFDPIYATTGIMPSMTRFEKLSAGLQTDSQRAPGAWIGLPLLLGYYEDMDHSRIGLVYQFPTNFSPVTYEHLTQNPIDNLCSLSDLLSRPDFEPKLEAKFRLAHNLANTVFDLHARGIAHGNLQDTSVSFCNGGTGDLTVGTGEVDVRRPLISSFDLFPVDPSQNESASLFSLYRHPLDPRTTSQSPLADKQDNKTLDLYSLAMLLVSIGLWTKLENLVPTPESPSISEAVLEQLAIRCGTLYMKAVQACWNAVDLELAGQASADDINSRAQIRASRYLEACCIIDGVSGLEERLSVDLGDVPAAQRGLSLSTSSLAGPSSKDARRASQMSQEQPTPVRESKGASVETNPTLSRAPSTRLAELPATSSPQAKPLKTRLYPQVPLPSDAIEQWNTVLMPQINSALRHFYRKNPESVEISLESIGESPLKTTPTVLVVCTSVAKVRSILKKKLGILFDGTTTGFALKVCRGSVLRSRKRGSARSMAKSHDGSLDEDEDLAANPDWQERPQNGASIGAWIGDRHLPPVSFGGLIMVDNKPYGMTVHHMLDDPDQVHSEPEGHKDPQPPIWRSNAASQHMQDLSDPDSSGDSSEAEDFACEFSDSGSEFSESDITSEFESDEEDEYELYCEDGDIPGVEPGCGDGYIITQPALDDVQDGFYPEEQTINEDHLDTFALGEVYASSGIRRRQKDGLVHEIDWALFEFDQSRSPEQNAIPRTKSLSKSNKKSTSSSNLPIQPVTVAPAVSLPGLEVQCIARTSGLQTGQILPALTSVKIYGRTSPSHTYQVSGAHNNPRSTKQSGSMSRVALGIPGDSGAWVVERNKGHLCGHFLAWSQKKQVAYICPMDVLLLDIAETLEAKVVQLPGGKPVIQQGTVDEEDEEEEQYRSAEDTRFANSDSDGDAEEESDQDQDDIPQLSRHSPIDSGSLPGSARKSERGSSPPSTFVRSTNDEMCGKTAIMRSLGGKLDDLHLKGNEIGVQTR